MIVFQYFFAFLVFILVIGLLFIGLSFALIIQFCIFAFGFCLNLVMYLNDETKNSKTSDVV